MKKSLGIVLLGVMLLGACESSAGASLGRLKVIGEDEVASDITIFEDTATGCQYMNTNQGYAASVTPILTPEGKPYCPQK
ncbi:hypothetical protein COK00_11820 [Bacillus cereus]|uniref:DUF6440 family protein n=1 Tax=Bacillus cereus TaxID=1396 RepID=UPI000BF70332|nr:DUF6440 family protein [Bacillus cereus]PFB64306.1 hypothetical protein CN291_16505 [Bacillus cereus]PFP65283.1 hypothetical protein COK00_11820 [Bacillus cereus]PGT10157.1 hypothetical protein COD03_20530 [Bacillus cereus]